MYALWVIMVKQTAVRELGIAWNQRELELQRRANKILEELNNQGTLFLSLADLRILLERLLA